MTVDPTFEELLHQAGVAHQIETVRLRLALAVLNDLRLVEDRPMFRRRQEALIGLARELGSEDALRHPINRIEEMIATALLIGPERQAEIRAAAVEVMEAWGDDDPDLLDTFGVDATGVVTTTVGEKLTRPLHGPERAWALSCVYQYLADQEAKDEDENERIHRRLGR